VAASNIVYFGAVRATVTAASVTNLVVTVPVGPCLLRHCDLNQLGRLCQQSIPATFPTGGTLGLASLSGPTN